MSDLILPPSVPYEWNPHAPSSLRDGLVFYGSGEHPGGTYYHDASGRENHGTLSGYTDPGSAWVWSEELGRSALDFDGTDDHVTIPHSASLAPENVTFGCWFQVLGLTNNWGLIHKGTASRDVWVYLYASRLRGNVGNNYPIYLSTTTLSIGHWYHLAITRDAATLRSHLNGIVEIDGSYTGSFSTTDPLYLGVGGTGFTHLPCVIADFFLYDGVLSASEIQWLADPTNHLRAPWRRRSWRIRRAVVSPTVEAPAVWLLPDGMSVVETRTIIYPTSWGTVVETATLSTRVDCTCGTATIQKHNAEVQHGAICTCAAGAVTVAPRTAEVFQGTAVACSVGSVTIESDDPTMSVATTVLCTVDLVTVAPFPTDVHQGTAIACGVSAVTIEAYDGDVQQGTAIGGTTGTVVSVGCDASMSVGTTATVCEGTVVVAGQAVNVSVGTTIAVANVTIAATVHAATAYQGTGVLCGLGQALVEANRVTVHSTVRVPCATGHVALSAPEPTVWHALAWTPTSRARTWTPAARGRVWTAAT